jgi:hypothetical protein
MKQYKITPNITAYFELDYLVFDKRHLKISEAKKYLLTYHEKLCNRFKVRSYVKDDKIHCHYAWDSIFAEAYNRFILQNIRQNRSTEYCTPTPI